jgi:hypothetical protein
MESTVEATRVSTSKKPRNKTRSDVKLSAEKVATIEQCLKLGMIQKDISLVTQINTGTIAAVKLVLEYLGRL